MLGVYGVPGHIVGTRGGISLTMVEEERVVGYAWGLGLQAADECGKFLTSTGASDVACSKNSPSSQECRPIGKLSCASIYVGLARRPYAKKDDRQIVNTEFAVSMA